MVELNVEIFSFRPEIWRCHAYSLGLVFHVFAPLNLKEPWYFLVLAWSRRSMFSDLCVMCCVNGTHVSG